MLHAPPAAASRSRADVRAAQDADNRQVRLAVAKVDGARAVLAAGSKGSRAAPRMPGASAAEVAEFAKNRMTRAAITARIAELEERKARLIDVGPDETIEFLLAQIVRLQPEYNELETLLRGAGSLDSVPVTSAQRARSSEIKKLTSEALSEIRELQADAATPELRTWPVPSVKAALGGGIPRRIGAVVILHEAAENDELLLAHLALSRAKASLRERLRDLPRAIDFHLRRKVLLEARRAALVQETPDLRAGTGHSGLGSGAEGRAQNVLYLLPERPPSATVPYALAMVNEGLRANATRLLELERARAGVEALRLLERGAVALSVDSFGRHGALRFVRRLLAGKETPAEWAARSGRVVVDEDAEEGEGDGDDGVFEGGGRRDEGDE
jgi:hypothetical protein